MKRSVEEEVARFFPVYTCFSRPIGRRTWSTVKPDMKQVYGGLKITDVVRIGQKLDNMLSCEGFSIRDPEIMVGGFTLIEKVVYD